MAKYYRLTYSAVYAEKIIKTPGNYSKIDIEKIYRKWFENQLAASGDYEEISEEEAMKDGIDENYCN